MIKRTIALLAVATLTLGVGVQAPASAVPTSAASVASVVSASKPGTEAGTDTRVRSDKDKHGMPALPGVAEKAGSKAFTLPPSGTIVYQYSGGIESATNDGAFVGMKIRDNYKSADSYHNLTELAVRQTVGDQNIVEIGWGKGSFCSTSAICLFGYHWVDGVGQGYNTGFQDYAGTNLNLGEALASETAGCASGSSKNERFGVRKLANGWGLWADLCFGDSGTGSTGVWIGEFPYTRWTSQGTAFTASDVVQVFNETTIDYITGSSTDDGLPCDDQGGSLATSTSGTGMRLADLKLQGVADSAIDMTAFASTGGGYFDAEQVGNYEAYVLAGQPAGNARYVNAGGLGFPSTTGDGTGALNC